MLFGTSQDNSSRAGTTDCSIYFLICWYAWKESPVKAAALHLRGCDVHSEQTSNTLLILEPRLQP